MKHITDFINESKGDPIDQQWINDDKPVMTRDGRPAIVKRVDLESVPNTIYGRVLMKGKLFKYEWDDTGMCMKAIDMNGNPKKPDDADRLVKAC